MGSAASLRPTVRAALPLAAAMLLALMLEIDARGQTPEQAEGQPVPAAVALEEEDLAKPMGPPDPFNRGTPRGSVYGFAVACRKGDYERAAQYLDLRQLPPDERERGPEIARQLRAALGTKLLVDFTNLSDSNEGIANDGLPAWQDRLGVIETREGLVTILLQRVPREGGRGSHLEDLGRHRRSHRSALRRVRPRLARDLAAAGLLQGPLPASGTLALAGARHARARRLARLPAAGGHHHSRPRPSPDAQRPRP